MALNLRKAIVRTAFINLGFVFGAGLLISLFSSKFSFSASNLVWLLLIAVGVGLFSAWQKSNSIAKSVQPNKHAPISYQKISRDDAVFNGVEIDWDLLDDFAAQLRNLGYSHLGDFSALPASKKMLGVAACYIDSSAAILVEVQYIKIISPSIHSVLKDGVHISIHSLLGGNIRVCTSNHLPTGSIFLLRGEFDVMAFYPNLGLVAVLEKHRRMLSNVQKRTHKLVSTGLNIERHVLLIRERMAYAAKRLAGMSGYAIAHELDVFESQPHYKWAPPSAELAALPVRALADFDQTVSHDEPPLIIAAASGHATINSANVDNSPGTSASEFNDELAQAQIAEYNTMLAEAMPEIEKSANWFYWVAALSLLNFILSVTGSDWAFALGLGLTQLLPSFAEAGNVTLNLVLQAASFAVIVLFAACGWLARKPSQKAFLFGMGLLALDTILLLIAMEPMALLIHAAALYFLWRGLGVVRQLQNLSAD